MQTLRSHCGRKKVRKYSVVGEFIPNGEIVGLTLMSGLFKRAWKRMFKFAQKIKPLSLFFCLN
jgi:hypothetical protein